MTTNDFRPGFTGMASGLFSWIADVLLYPIDTVSTRLKGSKTKPLVSTFTFLIQSIKKDGRGIYRGVTLTFPHSFVPTALYIFIYQHLLHSTSNLIDKYTARKQIKLIFPFFLSALAESIALILELPFDMIRARIQMNLPQYQYQSILKGLGQIYKSEGLLRFYKSTKVYFVTKTVYTASQFQFYEMLNYAYGHIPYSVFINAPLSAFLGAILINPLEVIITRYALVDTTKKKLVFSYLVKRLWQREGFSGFYKGFVTQALTKSFYTLLWMPVYQYMRDRYGVNLTQ